MKKLLALCSALFIILTLMSACGGDGSPNAQTAVFVSRDVTSSDNVSI